MLLKEFLLAISPDAFVDAFWLSSQWYEKFLVEKLLDVDVTIEEWTSDDIVDSIKRRKVRAFHPSKISFPGLPSHAEVSPFTSKNPNQVAEYIFCTFSSRLKFIPLNMAIIAIITKRSLSKKATLSMVSHMLIILV